MLFRVKGYSIVGHFGRMRIRYELVISHSFTNFLYSLLVSQHQVSILTRNALAISMVSVPAKSESDIDAFFQTVHMRCETTIWQYPFTSLVTQVSGQHSL